jgi:hypothetical protein
MSSIFSFFSDQIGGAINQITKQSEILDSSVTAPLKGMVNEVTGGMWKGDGANKFVAEMTSDVLPMLARLFVMNSSFAAGFTKATSRMEQAFQQASTVANTLNDVFGSIF